MARLLGPDAGSRLVYIVSGSLLRSAAGYTATVFSDAAGTTLANIATYDGTGTPGAVIAGSTLPVDSTSRLPLFWFPDGVPNGQDTLYVRVGSTSSPIVSINADYDARIDAIISGGGGGGGVTSVNGATGIVVLDSTNTPPASIGAAAAVHTHVAGDVTSGVFAIGRIPTGTTGTTVALGNHVHSGADITSGTVGIGFLPTGTTGTTVALGNHVHSGADITSGTVGITFLPTGTTGITVALGNHTHTGVYSPVGHTHAGADIVSGTVGITFLPTGTTGTTVALGNHTHTGVYAPFIALGTANQVLGVNAGASAQEYKTVAGTTGQVTVTHGVGTITISLPATITQAETFTADLTVSGADMLILGTGKGYRLKRSGASLDFDGTGADLYFSVYSGTVFDGTQRTYMRLESGAQLLHFIGRTIWGTSPFDTIFDFDPSTGVAKIGAKNTLANVFVAGRRASVGAPTTGTWAAGDTVQDSAGTWYLCTAGGTPGTWSRGGGPVITSGYVSTGDQTLTNVGSTWTPVPTLSAFTIPAVAGDRIRIQMSFLAILAGVNFLDIAIITSGTQVRYASTGTGTPAVEGDPVLYRDVSNSATRGTSFLFTAGAGDIAGGNVTFGLVYKGTGTTSTVFAGTNYPFRYYAENLGPA